MGILEKIGKGQSPVRRTVKRLDHKSWYGERDLKWDGYGLFLPPEGILTKLTDVRAIPCGGKIRENPNKFYQKR